MPGDRSDPPSRPSRSRGEREHEPERRDRSGEEAELTRSVNAAVQDEDDEPEED